MRAGGGPSDANRERLLEELLDGSLQGERREAAIIDLRNDPELASELVRLRLALETLRRDGERAPDLSLEILDELGRRRGFLARSMRIAGISARIAAVVGVVLAIGALAFVREESAGVLSPSEPAPMTRVVNAVQLEVGCCMKSIAEDARDLTDELGEIPQSASLLAQRMMRPQRPIAIDNDRDGGEKFFTFAIEPARAVVGGGRLVSLDSFDLSVRFQDAGYEFLSRGRGRAIWVVGDRSAWVSAPRPVWTRVLPVSHSPRRSSFGLVKDAGYP